MASAVVVAVVAVGADGLGVARAELELEPGGRDCPIFLVVADAISPLNFARDPESDMATTEA